jgi:CxxC motif-containing protein (DUF1111 family)
MRAARLAAALLAVASCGEETIEPPLAGGGTTVHDRTSNAYSFPAPNLTDDELERHLAGDVTFEATFVTAPAEVNAGLGPTYNNVACAACHKRDGRGMPIAGNGPNRSHLLVRVSLPDGEGEPAVPGGSVPVPGLGLQIQDQAIFGVDPEAIVDVTWDERPGAYADGTPYVLRAPIVTITLAGGGAPPDGCMTSLRQPPPVFGLGLLEAIGADTLEALADPDDRDGDGVSGRVNHVYDVATGSRAIGRFGHKANTPSLLQQAAAAYANDMGVSSSLFPDDGGARDIDDETASLTAFYTQTLAVPARTSIDDPIVRRGESLFAEIGCVSCHVETIETGAHEIEALSFQTIHPYTDLLLHDLGDGLADGRPDFEADGREWRTPPLWGIGLTHTVLPYSGFLHDGRARTLEEAILWHGGEAQAARDTFAGADAADREALIAFLRSL